MANVRSTSNNISRDEIIALEKQCLAQIKEDIMYAVKNDAKIRAVSTSNCYEDFKNIVDSAHLTPLSASDKQNAKTKHRIWNNTATGE